MTSLVPSIADIRPVPASSLSSKFIIAIALAALADWLIYGQRIGISIVVLAIAVSCGSLLANFTTMNRRRALLAGVLACTGLLPAIEEVNAASVAFMVLALGVALLLATSPNPGGLGKAALALCDLFLIGPLRFFLDAAGVFNLPALTRGFTLWFVPVLLGTVFVFLFVAANPILAKWISLMNPGDPASYLSTGRLLFWIAALALVWPFIHVWRRSRTEIAAETAAPVVQESAVPADLIDFFSAATILRSLILFNLLFAVQTALDAIFLWGNVELPADITCASYAHRGAYPLIVTALLAAGFVLAAMRPDGPAEHSKVIRPLVYLWVAQNVLLVASSILRLISTCRSISSPIGASRRSSGWCWSHWDYC